VEKISERDESNEPAVCARVQGVSHHASCGARTWKRIFFRGADLRGANLRETLLRSAVLDRRRWARGAGVRERDGRKLYGAIA